jgi:selenide,water dikinase
MELGNAHAAKAARLFGATALTDVTGFGLTGHLLPMLAGDLRAEIDLSVLPALPGALGALDAGVRSTMHAANVAAFAPHVSVEGSRPGVEALLYDPQTCGGLLMAIPADQAEAACAQLQSAGLPAALIGDLYSGAAGEALAPRIVVRSA